MAVPRGFMNRVKQYCNGDAEEVAKVLWAEAMKHIPVWRIATSEKDLIGGTVTFTDDRYTYYIKVSDLHKLPKEGKR